MAYTSKNFKSKAELRRALDAGEEVTCYSPGLGTVPENGIVYLEGPWYPKPHTWYAQGAIRDGKLIKVR